MQEPGDQRQGAIIADSGLKLAYSQELLFVRKERKGRKEGKLEGG